MALLAGAKRVVSHDSCSPKQKVARTSHRMGSQSLSRGVELFLAQNICCIRQTNESPRGKKQAILSLRQEVKSPCIKKDLFCFWLAQTSIDLTWVSLAFDGRPRP